MLSQQQELQGLLVQGIEEARRSSQSVLVSQLTRVAYRDPLSFFAVGTPEYTGERMYWSTPRQDVVLVGLGAAYTFQTEQGNAYAQVEQAWQTLVEKSIVDPQPSDPETGPILLGGFSFDPLKPKTSLWYDFPDTRMVLPQFMLTVKGQETWLTTNCVLHPHDDVYEELNKVQAEQDRLLQNQSFPNVPAIPVTYKLTEKNVQQWLEAVGKTAADIRKGLLEKVVLAREIRLHLSDSVPPERVLSRLREEQTDSYIFAVESGSNCFLGASPERLVKRQGNKMISACMAGSIQRGNTVNEDERLGKKLLQDRKNLREHEVVVQMIKEAMSKACEIVHAPAQPQLYKTKDIQHLYTPVQGMAQAHTSLLSTVEQLSPTPALGGYPRHDALERIRETEMLDRGWYAAPIGWINGQGDGEFAVAIRSGLLRDQEAVLFAGCGIVGDSDPANEYEETRMKLQPMLSAVGGWRP